MNYATYQTTPSKNGKGTFYLSDCGHTMYSVLDPEAYHGKLCTGCLNKGIQTTLYIRRSEEANRIIEERIKNGEDIPLIRWDLKFVKGEENG